MSGLFQALLNIGVTIINYLIIISDHTITEIVIDFLALYVITELDDYVFKVHSPDDLSLRIVTDINEGKLKELFRIETTSSRFGGQIHDPLRIERYNHLNQEDVNEINILEA